MQFKFSFQNKNYKLEVKECRRIFSQALGLMFGFNKKPLLFIFKNKKRRAIHSFFCKPFIAIWFDKDKIIEYNLVEKWKSSIKPKEGFDKLLEIPSGTKEFLEFNDGNI